MEEECGFVQKNEKATALNEIIQRAQGLFSETGTTSRAKAKEKVLANKSGLFKEKPRGVFESAELKFTEEIEPAPPRPPRGATES